MQYSAKPQRVNSKIKNNNGQIASPYNAGIHLLTTPNSSNSGQLQINRKYINSIGHINSVSVLQYQRTTNMHVKNNNLEMNHYQNLRHQQQAFVYKAPQYQHNNTNLNFQQKLPFNTPVQRKNFKEQTEQQPQMNSEVSIRTSRELQHQQETYELSNKHKDMHMKFRKLPQREINYSEQSEVSLTKQQQVPQNVHLSDESWQANKENHPTEAQQDVVQTLNIVEESEDQCEEPEASDKSGKNGREKTPMCLINDLARFNKISFQYRLTSESGPAHCKRFTVTLMLGDEEYTAEGLKIKEAQHLAAKEAIEKTKYKHPKPKTNRRTDDNAKSNITPTVELNALAMKLGQQTCYIFDPQQLENKPIYRSMSQSLDTKNALQQEKPTDVNENLINNYKQIQTIHRRRNFFPKFQNRFMPFQHSQQVNSSAAYTYFPPTSPCKITLIVGTEEFTGVGRTVQQAKHDAASNALKVLKEQIVNEELETHNENMEDNESKSPISLVFEIGIRKSLPVDFKVLREEGPAHMRTFVTACVVGHIVTEGEGTGKKISKKKAAQKMLEELKKLPPTPAVSPVKRTKLKTYTKKNCDQSKNMDLTESKGEMERPSHKNKKVATESDSTNPITKLLEWHQNQKENEPEFKLISEVGKENSRRRQFVMEVTSDKIVTRGVGSSKKLAKQNAAQKLLIAISERGEQPKAADKEKSTKKTDSEINKNDTETTFNKMAKCSQKRAEQDEDQNYGIVERDSKPRPASSAEMKNSKKSIDNSEFKNNSNEATSDRHILEEEICENALSKKKSCSEMEKNEAKNTVTNAASKETTNTAKSLTKSQNLHMKDQLMYLANLLGFDVEFSDYPKGNHNEFLTIVMLSTTPPQICHGVGVNANESQEDAAKNALKILSEMGLNNAVKS